MPLFFCCFFSHETHSRCVPDFTSRRYLNSSSSIVVVLFQFLDFFSFSMLFIVAAQAPGFRRHSITAWNKQFVSLDVAAARFLFGCFFLIGFVLEMRNSGIFVSVKLIEALRLCKKPGFGCANSYFGGWAANPVSTKCWYASVLHGGHRVLIIFNLSTFLCSSKSMLMN